MSIYLVISVVPLRKAQRTTQQGVKMKISDNPKSQSKSIAEYWRTHAAPRDVTKRVVGRILFTRSDTSPTVIGRRRGAAGRPARRRASRIGSARSGGRPSRAAPGARYCAPLLFLYLFENLPPLKFGARSNCFFCFIANTAL